MDTLSCLWQQNEVADSERYGTKNFPLYCPKCRQESLIEAKDLQVTVITESDTVKMNFHNSSSRV